MGFIIGEKILVIYDEEGREKRAVGILTEETDTAYLLECDHNLLSIAKKTIIKVKQKRGEKDGP